MSADACLCVNFCSKTKGCALCASIGSSQNAQMFAQRIDGNEHSLVEAHLKHSWVLLGQQGRVLPWLQRYGSRSACAWRTERST